MVTVTTQISALDNRILQLEQSVKAQQEDLRRKQAASPGGRFNQEQGEIRDTAAQADRLKAERSSLVQLQTQIESAETSGQTVTEEEQGRQINLRQASVRQAETLSLVADREQSRTFTEQRATTPQPTESEVIFQQSFPADIRGLPARDIKGQQSFLPRPEPVVFQTGQPVAEQPTFFETQLTPEGRKAVEFAKPKIEAVKAFEAKFNVEKQVERQTGQDIKLFAQPVPITVALPMSAIFNTKPPRIQFVGASQQVSKKGLVSDVGFKIFSGKTTQVGRIKGLSAIKQQGSVFKVETFAKGSVSRKVLGPFGKVSLRQTKAIVGVESGGGIVKGSTSIQTGAGFVAKAGRFRTTASPVVSISQAVKVGKISKIVGVSRTKFQTGLLGGAVKEVAIAPKGFQVLKGIQGSTLARPTLKLLTKQSLFQTQSIAAGASIIKPTISPAPGLALLPGFKPQSTVTTFIKPTKLLTPQVTQKPTQALQQKQFAIQIPAQDITFKQSTGLAQPQKTLQKQKAVQKAKQAQLTIPVQATTPRFRTPTITRTIQPPIQKIRPPFAPFVPLLPRGPGRTPKPFPVFLPEFSFEIFKPGRIKGQRELFRQPSFAAAQLGITAPTPGPLEFTGLVERPLIKRRRKKK